MDPTINGARWDAVRTGFERALSLPEAARAAYLDLQCAGDAQLRAEIEALLKVATSAPRAAPQEHATLGWDAASEPRDALIGRVLGHWRVVGVLGAGGMGAVYLGQRVSGDFEQDVAIKVLHIGIGQYPEIAARFRAERQILAQLDHPYIARLLDGGTLPEGLPYLVMERVEGDPIALHCGLRHLQVPARVELMIKVCRAVQAAHRNLIVHRDLKPDNILVDAHGEPKLLDFGIAKVLDDAGGVQTHADQRLLTPRYGAPEQFQGGAITTATDVYALGVILYELLTGVSPYESPAGEPMSLIRQVCDVEPHSPSARRERLSRHGAAVDDLRFGGDLDAIVMKALRKLPAERYGTVDALIDDLQRYLRDEPVLARQGSRAYLLRKFVRRHRLALALSTLAAVSLLATALLWRQQRDEVARERDKARATTAFLVDLFDQGDPFLHTGKPPTVEEVVHRGALRLMREDLVDPLLRAELSLTLSRVTHQIGAYGTALELARRADADARHGRAGPMLGTRTAARLAQAMQEGGHLHESEGIWRRALELAVQAGPAADTQRVEALAGLGDLHREGRKYAAAEDFLREALELQLRLAGFADLAEAAQVADSSEPARRLAEVAHALCRVRAARGPVREAELLCLEVLALKQRSFGADHPNLASTLNELAGLRMAAGDRQAALELSRRVLALMVKVLGPDHPRVGVGHLNLGADLRAMGQLDEAESEAREALRIFTAARGADHAHTLLAGNNLANILYSQARYEEALAGHRDVAERRARTLEGDDPALAQSQFNIGKCLYQLARFDEAASAWRESLRIGQAGGADAADQRLAELGLALVRLAQGDPLGAQAEAARIATAIRAGGDSQSGLATALYVQARARHEVDAGDPGVQDLAAQAQAAMATDSSRDLLDVDRLQALAAP